MGPYHDLVHGEVNWLRSQYVCVCVRLHCLQWAPVWCGITIIVNNGQEGRTWKEGGMRDKEEKRRGIQGRREVKLGGRDTEQVI